jgi:DNA repair protein RadC
MKSPRDNGTTYLREVIVNYRRRRVPEPIRQPFDAVGWFRSIAPDNAREHFMALYLDARHRPIAWRLVTTGTATESLVHPREVLQPALLVGAVAVIVAHNHPSGDPAPSPEDVAMTTRLRQACELLGIRLLDSLVFTDEGKWESMK